MKNNNLGRIMLKHERKIADGKMWKMTNNNQWQMFKRDGKVNANAFMKVEEVFWQKY